MFGAIGAIGYDIISRDKTKEGLDSAGDRAAKVGKAVGMGITAVGASLTLLTDKAKKMQAPIRMTALQLGATTEEIRELALATTNVTFPLSEVTASFDLLTRAGMADKDAIAATATAFDTLGDATGKTASQITTMMVPAFNAFKIPLEDASEYVDLFTHLQRTTTIELESFSGMVNYLAADLDTMDLSLENSIAVMEALADKGIQGSSATREFRTAVTAADGDVVAFYEALGLTEAEVKKYTDELADAEGMTQKYADAANSQYGTVDKLKQKVSELTLKYGALLEPLDTLGPVMTGLGPMIMTYAMLQTSAAAAGTTLTASIWASTVAFLASPLGIFIIAVGGVIAILYILEKKFGLLTKTSDILSDAIHRLVDWFKVKLAPGIEFVRAIVTRFGDKLLFLLGPIGAVIYGLKKLHGWLKKDKEEISEAEQATKDFGEEMEEMNKEAEKTSKEMGEAARMLHNLTNAFDNVGAEEAAMDMGEFTDVMKDVHPEIEEYENLLYEAKMATEDLAFAQGKVGESKEEVNKLTEAYNDLERAMSVLADEEEDREDMGFRIKDATYAEEDAQERYNEAVKEFGGSSKEAERAQHDLEKAIDRREDAERDLVNFNDVIIGAETEKTRVLTENNAADLQSLKDMLESKTTEYEGWVNAEITERERLETARGLIAEAETEKGIIEWNKLKDEIEENPVQAEVIINYITKKKTIYTEAEEGIYPFGATTPGPISASMLPLPEAQYGGIVPGPIGAAVPIIAHGGEAFLGMGGRTERPPIEIKVEATIYNYGDVEYSQRTIAEAVQMGIDDAYGMA